MKPHLDRFCKQSQRTQWLCAAVGSSLDELPLTISDDLGGSTLLPPLDDTLLKSGKQRMVPIFTIDHLIKEKKSLALN